MDRQAGGRVSGCSSGVNLERSGGLAGGGGLASGGATQLLAPHQPGRLEGRAAAAVGHRLGERHVVGAVLQLVVERREDDLAGRTPSARPTAIRMS
jgi:hypothetical protein